MRSEQPSIVADIETLNRAALLMGLDSPRLYVPREIFDAAIAAGYPSEQMTVAVDLSRSVRRAR